jgi:hypothetical protein
MDKIIIKVPGAPDREIELAPGVHKVGRSINTDLQIDHPSVSGSHCEIIVNDGTVTVKDMGSTNGISLDGQRVPECQIVPGQTLRLGDTELFYAPALVPKPGLTLAAGPAPVVPHQVRLAPPRPRRAPKNFYRSIPGAFVYPFKRNGLLLLVSGTVVFGVFDFFISYRVGGKLMVGAIIGGLFAAMAAGYLFLYLQTIITSTALGDDEMPAWPDYEGWWDSAAEPYLRLLVIGLACITPANLCFWFAGDAGRLLFVPMLLVGCCYAPMALLAVAMDDSLLALNPMLVVPSILRVPLEYLVSCVMLVVLLAGLGGLIQLADNLQQPFISQILGMFLSLYIAVVVMRLLGLLYYTRKERLGWRV